MQAATTSYSSEVLSFIPLLYVAWADGLLSPSEVQIIQRRINEVSLLNDADRTLLTNWSNPRKWPPERTFRQWMGLMKEAGEDLDLSATTAIVDLGLAMARRAKVDNQAVDLAGLEDVLTQLQEELQIPAPAKFRALRQEADHSVKVSASDATALQKFIDGDGEEVKDRIKKVLADPIFERAPFRTKEIYRSKILEWLTSLAKQGYGALGYPEQYGGQGDIIKYATVFESLAYFDLSLAVKFGVQFGLFGGSVQHLGTSDHHDKYLRQIGDGKLLGCFAMTETGHGSNVRDLETTAIYDAETHTLEVHSPTPSAGKEYIGNALHSTIATVFAQLIVQGENQGVHAILVPLRDADHNLLPGIRVEDCGYKLGLNGIDNGRIWFDKVRVPRENLLDRFGKITLTGRYESPIANPSKRFFTMLGTLVAGRLCVAKGGISAAKSALTIAIKYGLKRRQFGPDKARQETLLLDYPSHQRRLMPPLAKVYACEFALQDLVHRYQHRQESDIRRIEGEAAGVKAYATWLANDTIQECREACGGKGYLWENRFADLRADTDIFATFEGDNTVLMQLVAKGLLSSFKEDFNDAGFMGAIRYLATQMSDSFLKINPIYKRKTDSSHLADPAFHLHAFRFRQRKLLFSLGSRMRNMFRKRITPYDVFLRSQNHMLELARAYIELIILEAFQKRLKDAPSEITDGPLNIMYQLFALSTIEDNKAWYLEQDYLEAVKTKAIRRTVDRLCEQARNQSEVLVDAFGIPRHILGSKII